MISEFMFNVTTFGVNHSLGCLGSKIDPLVVSANGMTFAYAVMPHLRHLS